MCITLCEKSTCFWHVYCDVCIDYFTGICNITNLEETEVALVILAEDEPANHQETMKLPNASRWWKACKEEYQSLLSYHTWALVERPPDINIVGSQWTFRFKRDNLRQVDKFKSWLVAQRFSQISSLYFIETFSDTIRFTSIQFILTMAGCYNLKLWHVNVKSAYLNRILDNDIYIHQPKGFIKSGEEHLICKLNKGIYSSQQVGWVWHQTLKGELGKIGLKLGDADSTIYFCFRNNGSIQIAG